MTGDRLRAAFDRQAVSCAALGSPFMARLCRLLSRRLVAGHPVADRILGWPGDVGSDGASVPLRLAGALHALCLTGHPGLQAVYPPAQVDDATLWQAVDRAMRQQADVIDSFLDSAPQTNEVGRAAAVIPAIWWALAQHDLPVVLSELGASAGLNLWLDQFALVLGGRAHGPADSAVRLAPDWSGAAPTPRAIVVAERGGVDLNPRDPRAAPDALRLMAYLWPDQPERIARTRAAIALAGQPPDKGDAAGWLAARLATRHEGRLHVVFHTIAWQYFPPATKAAAAAALHAAGARASPDAPLVHIAMEADGATPGAGLTARLWPAPPGQKGAEMLARVDFHGRWVDWRAQPCPASQGS